MENFGDEFTIESYRIPWLVWIQVIVMILLLILIYCFSLLVLDLSGGHSNNTTTSSSSTTKPSSSNSTSRLLVSDDYINRPLSNYNSITTTLFANRLQNTQVGESMKEEIVTSTSRIMRAEDIIEMDASTSANLYFHPCFYFRLAKIAFLKCLGLDSNPENSSPLHRGKRKES